MNKDDWKAFLYWLETASDKELETKILKIEARLLSFSDEGVRGDAQRMIKAISNEIDARRQVQKQA